MLRHSFLALLVLTLLPLAAASGPGASVDTLTQADACTDRSQYDGWSYSGSYGNYTYGNSGSSDSRARHCASEADTIAANVSDGAGTLADARVYQQNSSHYASQDNQSNGWSNGPYGSSYNSQRESSYSFADSDARGVRADALGATAGETSGCHSSSAGSRDQGWNSYYSSYNGSSHSQYWSDQSYNDQDINGCGDIIDGSIAGHGASAGPTSECAFSYASERHASGSSSSSSTYGNSSSSQTWSDRASANSCREGVVANAEDAALFAGREDQCSQRNFTSASYYSQDGGPYSSSNGSWASSKCFNGYAVDGPDGFSATAGRSTSSNSYCNNGQCESYQRDEQSVSWYWGPSPIRALQGGSFVPPVDVPILA